MDCQIGFDEDAAIGALSFDLEVAAATLTDCLDLTPQANIHAECAGTFDQHRYEVGIKTS